MHLGVFATVLLSGLCLVCSLCELALGPCQQPESESSTPQAVVVEEVRFRHGDDILAGSLFRPELSGAHVAVALVLGSGAQVRAYGGVGTALGRHFARHGFVCLAWDKPGIGKSTGDYQVQTFRDRAEEALAAIRFLRGRADVRHDAIGIWGHSQGGMVAPVAASLPGDVAFVIEVSGWQGPAWQQDPVRVEAELGADGFAEEDIRKAATFARMRMDLIRGTGTFEDLDKAQEAVKTLPWFEYVHRCDRALFYSARRNVGYDNGQSWEKVRCPVLVIYGDKDTSSGPAEGLVSIIRRGLTKAGNKDITVRIFQDADHSLCKTETGGRKEGARRAAMRKKEEGPDFVPGYLDTMIAWLDGRFSSRR